MRHLARTFLTLAILSTSAATAGAATLDFQGFAHGYETVDFALTGANTHQSGAVAAGGFLSSLNGGPSFVSYCVDLYQTIAFSDPAYANYVDTSIAAHAFANADAATDLARLYAAAPTIDSSIREAAFQIAAWEIAYETTPHYSLAGGTARFSGGTAATSGALSLASTWLDSLGSHTASVNLHVLESGEHQDVVYAAPVPEPSTYALLLAGLTAVTASARRRAKAGTANAASAS